MKSRARDEGEWARSGKCGEQYARLRAGINPGRSLTAADVADSPASLSRFPGCRQGGKTTPFQCIPILLSLSPCELDTHPIGLLDRNSTTCRFQNVGRVNGSRIYSSVGVSAGTSASIVVRGRPFMSNPQSLSGASTPPVSMGTQPTASADV